MAGRSSICLQLFVGLVLIGSDVVAAAGDATATNDATAAGVPAAPDSKANANAHFYLGVQRYKDGRYDEAIVEFRRAYDTVHDHGYLYNLGQAYVARWMPIEAVEVLEQYLREGGTSVASQRRAQVQQEIARQQSRLAWLEVYVTPDGADVKVDGRAVGRSPLKTPVVVTNGSHVISVSRPGYQSVEQEVRLKGQERLPVQTALVPTPPPPRVGQLAIPCRLPDVAVMLDGRQVATTPLSASLVAEEGQHTLRLERVGYLPQETLVEVRSSRPAQLPCDMRLAPSLNPAAVGRLKLDLSESGSEVWVDGSLSSLTTTLPAGPHMLEVQRSGFVRWERELSVVPGETSRVSAVLVPTPAYLQDYQSRAQIRRNWSYWLGGAGALMVVATAVVWGLNHQRYSDWEKEHASLQEAYRAPSSAEDNGLEAKQDHANSLLRSVHAVDVWTAVLGVAAGALLTGGAVLYWGGDDPYRYSQSGPRGRTAVRSAGLSLAW